MYTRPQGAKRMETVKRLLEPLIHPHGRYLDLGCGLGRYTTWIADRTDHGQVCGVDISQDSIDRAERRWNTYYTRVSWEDLPYMGAFDVVLATEVLEHAQDPEKLVRKFPAATWVVTVPRRRPAPEENRWAPVGHGYLQTFDGHRTLCLFGNVSECFADDHYYYLVAK